jgi:hypothetical protein
MPFPDPIPMPGWNHDWTSDNAWVYAAYDVRWANQKIDAFNERVHASLDAGPFTGDAHLVSRDPGSTRLTSPHLTTRSLISRHVRAMDASGNPINYTGDFEISTADYRPGEWPLRQRYPRWINNTASTVDQFANPVADGNTAMVVGSSAVNGSNTGRLFTRSAGVWVYNPAATEPDKAIDPNSTGTNVGQFGPRLGDYFCGEYINEDRDGMNSAVMFTGAVATWDSHSNHAYGASSNSASDAMAMAQAEWATGTNVSSVTDSPSAQVYYLYEESTDPVTFVVSRNYQYYVNRTWGTPTITNFPMAGVCNYQVFGFTTAASRPAYDPFSPTDDRVFKTFGDDVAQAPNYPDPADPTNPNAPDNPGTNQLVRLFFSSGITSATSVTCAQLGTSACPSTPWPTGTNFAKWGYFQTGLDNIFTRYDVSGGFQYTR